jgi:hypothetical protein
MRQCGSRAPMFIGDRQFPWSRARMHAGS